jgi:hypothetical protein
MEEDEAKGIHLLVPEIALEPLGQEISFFFLKACGSI